MKPTLILRVLAAIALFGVSAIHLDVAGNYSDLGKHPLTLGDQFYAQAAGGIVLALALLIKPHWLVWAGATGFAIVSLAVLVYSRKHSIPIYGVPGGYQESWAAKGAKPAAWFESFALLFSLAGTALSLKAVKTGKAVSA